MVSRGCRTCVQRRVKCDTANPICERCTKGKRTCVWDPNAQGGLRFQDESAYAQGKARRPRRTIPKPSSSTAVVATRVTLLTPSRALTLSLDDHAFQYWAMTNVSQADTLHEAAHEWHTHVIPYWAKAKPGLCLQLAILTLSRAVFGRARRSPQALVQADRSYAQCLHRTQQAVSGKSNENMDELLLTAMMMGYFENIRYNTGVSETSVRKTDAVGSRFTNVFCHYEGAMGLLRIRRELGGMESDKTLDKVARRQIIRASILRGNTIPDWLQHGEDFGETGPVLRMDSFMVRVAAFRSRALQFFSRAVSALPTSTPDLDYLAHTGKQLEDDLVQWAESMSDEWECRRLHLSDVATNDNSDNLYEDHHNSYTSHGHALLWLRQRALRLIINSIFIKFISVRMQNSTNHAHLVWKQNRMRGNLDSISSELCGDISYFFSSVPSVSDGISVIIHDAHPDGRTILPSLAGMLAWPLAIAVSTENVPEPQRQWLQAKLGVIAGALGDAVLHDVGRRGAFVF